MSEAHLLARPSLQMQWKALIEDEMAEHGESWENVEFSVGFLTTPEYTLPAFTVWTRARVYFPAGYDGDFWATSVPRHPCSEVVHSVGC